MKDQLLELYEARIDALELELELTRLWIYRHTELNSGWSSNVTQDCIDYFIAEQKSEAK